MPTNKPSQSAFDAGRNHQVSNDEGMMTVYDERGRKTTPIEGTGVTIGDKRVSEEELQALKETNPKMHAELQQMRTRAAGTTIRTSGGGTRKVDVQTEQTAPKASKMGTNEAYDRVNALHKTLQAHARSIAGTRYPDGSPRRNTVATNDEALTFHTTASQKIAEAGAAIDAGRQAGRNTAYAATRYKAAFGLLKSAHDDLNAKQVIKATGKGSPIADEAMKAHSAKFEGFGAGPKTKSTNKVVITRDTTLTRANGEQVKLKKGEVYRAQNPVGSTKRRYKGDPERVVSTGYVKGADPRRVQEDTNLTGSRMSMKSNVPTVANVSSPKKSTLGPEGATPAESGNKMFRPTRIDAPAQPRKSGK